jgi:PAS domain S-box-containing protein
MNQGTMRILIVEDNETEVFLLGETLSEIPNLAVELLHETRLGDGLARLGEGGIDLVLLDLGLPDSVGIDTFSRFQEKSGAVPVIVLTSLDDEEVGMTAVRMGAQDYLIKKRVQPDVFARSITYAVERQQISAELETKVSQLKASESRLGTILESSRDAVIIVAPGGEVRYRNPAAEAMFGGGIQAFARTIPTCSAEIPEIEVEIPRRDGTGGTAEMVVIETCWGEEPVLMASLRDVTARKRALEQVRDQATVLERARDAIVIGDLDDRVVFWNDGAMHLFGWSSNDILQRSTAVLFPPEARAALRAAREAVMADGEWLGELRPRTRDGHDLVVWSHWTLLRDDKGRPKRILSVNSDLTERRKIEIQLRQAQRLDSLGVLAGGVAHDFNNVLTMIVGYADMIGNLLPEDHRAVHYLTMIQQASGHASDLIRRILTFSRTGETDPAPVRIASIVEEVVSLMSSSVPPSVELRTRLAPDLPVIDADATQIHQAIMNLCSNAVQSIDGPGRVEIDVQTVDVGDVLAATSVDLVVGPYVRISVRDNGVGMSEETLERIFEPFFSTKKPGRGTGLGLSVIHGIVKNHRGAITVNSELGRGTAFHIYLPLAPSREDAGSRRAGWGVAGTPRAILVADDALLMSLGAALGDLGYAVTAYRDPAAALQTFRSSPGRFDVAFIDSIIPKMTGFELTSAIRLEGVDIPIVLMTSERRPGHDAMAGLVGATRLVTRSDSPERTAEKLHAAVSAPVEATSGGAT